MILQAYCETHENQMIMAIKAAYFGGLLLYYGMQRLDLVTWPA